MIKIKHLLLFTLLILFSGNIIAQEDAYKIKIKLKNSQDTCLRLVSYYHSSNQIIDTTYIQKGFFTFKGEEKLAGGIYLIVFQNNKYFELIIDKEQFFSVEADTKNTIMSMKIKGSKDNVAFYEYQQKLNPLGRKEAKLSKEYKKHKDNPEKQKAIYEEVKKINEEVKELKLDFVAKNKNSLFAKVILASKEPDAPKELPLKEDGTPDSSYIYKYYKAHFFDDFDFADKRLLRTPIYASKIKKYFKRVLMQHPDTLIKECIAIIEKAKADKETYKYCIWYFTYEAETSKIMGMDRLFVALGKKYYLTGEAYWISDKTLKRMTKRINTLDRLLIGKQSPNMIMQDTALQLQSLHQIKAKYTIILFWDPDCGHCKTEVKTLKKWYDLNADKYDTKVFSVCSDTSIVKWMKKIHEYGIEDWVNVNGPRSITENYHDLYDIISTPTVYLIDEKKKILAKRISCQQTTDFIMRDFEYNDKKKE